MSYPDPTELGRLKIKLQKQKSKLAKLKSGDSSIWKDIEARLLRLQIISTREQIDKLIQEMANSNN